jgi:hypothetical protein
MASYYISSSTGSNTTGDGSQGNPWGMFKGKCDGNYFLQPGDTVYFKRGDFWLSSSAEVVVNSSGTQANKITITTYGTGPDPVFYGANTTLLGWIATGVSSIYTLTGQNQTHLKVVTQGSNRALGLWNGTTSNLVAGTFKRSGSNLYVHLWDDADPSVSEVRVANFAHSSSADGARGLVSSSRANGTRGSYVNWYNLKVVCANGVGMSSSSPGNYFYDCAVMGAGIDGVLFYAEIAGSGENATDCRWYRGEISYAAANNAGSGAGQGWTTYAAQSWIVDCGSHNGTTIIGGVHDNFMAGVDFLDFNANTAVNSGGCLRCYVFNNGRWEDANSADPNIYVDGASDIFLYGNVSFNAGVNNTLGFGRASIAAGSEHPTTKPTTKVYIVNNLIHNSSYDSTRIDNANAPENTMEEIYVINNTVISRLQAGGVMGMYWEDINSINGTFHIKNNIFVIGSNSNCGVNIWTSTSTYLDSNYNIFWKINNGTDIFKTGGGSGSITLEQWRSGTSQDSASTNSSPLIVSYTGTAPDVHLQASSRAIQMGTVNPYTPPAWLPADLFPYGGGVRGIARSDGTVDPGLTALDLGYHYNSGDNFSSSSINYGVFRISRDSTITINRDAKLSMVAV